ncbi:MAG TPA: TetR/AcrR family transcriptional regulator [Thermoanaerobaculia bacterium]|nr:TetR/AcrR family transcriptional regulator [Thermoanaerobaculia bacterium]
MAARKRQEEKSEASVSAVLDAGLELFSTQGYRATTLRDIASKAGLSVGNIYHHFPDKHAIYQRLIDRYWERLLDPELPLNQVFARATFPEDLEDIAAAIEQVVGDNAAHILLIYVDIIEFQGDHVRAFYEGMAKRFAAAYGPRFAARKKAGEFGDADPMTAVMVATRWLFYFFTVEKCFGVPLHLGMTSGQATTEFIRLLRYGLLRDRPQNGGRPRSAVKKNSAAKRNSAAKPAARARNARQSKEESHGR